MNNATIKLGDKVRGFFNSAEGLVPFVGILEGFDIGGGISVKFLTEIRFSADAPVREGAYFSASDRRRYVKLELVESAPEDAGEAREITGGIYGYIPTKSAP